MLFHFSELGGCHSGGTQLLETEVLLDWMLCRWVSHSRRFEGTGQFVFMT